MELSLGRFGDRRLEKGGPIFWGVLLRRAVTPCGCVVLAAIGPGRFG
jgi:hypothetical protein